MPSERVFDHLRELGVEAERVQCPDAPFPIWLVAARSAPCAIAWTLLCPRERQRAVRFANPQLQARYVAAHAALRILVEAYFGVAVYRQTFTTTTFGKPRLAGYPEIQCNLSYSDDRILIGVAPGAEIGLDIERIRAVADAAELVKLYFTAKEKSLLQSLPPDSLTFHQNFLTIWTRKEACLKAVGQGLNFYLNTLECAFEDAAAPATVRIGRSQVHAGAIHISNHAASWARAIPLSSQAG